MIERNEELEKQIIGEIAIALELVGSHTSAVVASWRTTISDDSALIGLRAHNQQAIEWRKNVINRYEAYHTDRLKVAGE